MNKETVNMDTMPLQWGTLGYSSLLRSGTGLVGREVFHPLKPE